VTLTRAEGPAVNSPARVGGGLEEPESEVRRPALRRRTFGAHGCETPIFPAFTAGATHCRSHGPGAAASCRNKAQASLRTPKALSAVSRFSSTSDPLPSLFASR
jgi:hypothetical protein